MNFVSIKTIMNNLMEHPMLRDLTLEKVVRHAADFIQLVGMPEILLNKEATLKVDKYKADLPCDFFELIQVRSINCECPRFFKKSVSSFKEKCTDAYTYRIEGSKIWLSMEKGTIEISYHAIALDDDGFPMLPNDIYFIKALELYIKKFYFKILYDTGDINRFQMADVEQDYQLALAQCVNHLSMPSPEDVANIKYMLESYLLDQHGANTGYRTMTAEVKPTVQ